MKYYHYFVEGETEEKLVSLLKTNLQCVQAGKIEVVNVVTEEIRKSMIMKLKKGTIVVLIFDTDCPETSILFKNLEFLNKQKSVVSSVICIPQCSNLEDELIDCCQISQIKELTNSKSNKDFKRDFLHMNDQNAIKRLKLKKFDIQKLWSKSPNKPFEKIKNQSDAIKIK